MQIMIFKYTTFQKLLHYWWRTIKELAIRDNFQCKFSKYESSTKVLTEAQVPLKAKCEANIHYKIPTAMMIREMFGTR